MTYQSKKSFNAEVRKMHQVVDDSHIHVFKFIHSLILILQDSKINEIKHFCILVQY